MRLHPLLRLLPAGRPHRELAVPTPPAIDHS
jgi:hypothetical protein